MPVGVFFSLQHDQYVDRVKYLRSIINNKSERNGDIEQRIQAGTGRFTNTHYTYGIEKFKLQDQW